MGTITHCITQLENKKVYLGTNVFIYFFDQHPIYFPVVAPLFLAIEVGNFSGVTGNVTIAEVLVKPYQIGNQSLVEHIKMFFNTANFLSISPHTAEIFDVTAQLRAAYKYKFIDALHLATAIQTNCHYFITNDKGITANPNISILYLSDLKQ